MYQSILRFSKLIRLYKEDLLDLDKIIRGNLLIDQENSEYYRIRVSYKNRNIIKNSMDDLLAENLPDIVDNIGIEVTAFNKQNKVSKYLVISFSIARSEIYVSGENEVWVNGISSTLNSFFIDKVAPYSSIKKSLSFISSALMGLSIPIMIMLYIKESYISGTLLLLSIPLFAYGAFSKRAHIQFPYVKIMTYSKNSKKESDKNNFLNIGTLLAFLSLVVGVLSLIVDILK